MTEYKEIMIKQTSYCDLAQSKSKSPTLNKKKKQRSPFSLFGPRGLEKFVSTCKKNQKKPLQILVSNFNVPERRLPLFLFSPLFLPSCTAQSGQILTYSSLKLCVECVCVSVCARVLKCAEERVMRDSEAQSGWVDMNAGAVT